MRTPQPHLTIPYNAVDDLLNRLEGKLDANLSEPQSEYLGGYNDALSFVLNELHELLTASAAAGEVQP